MGIVYKSRQGSGGVVHRHIARDSPTNCNIKSETLFKGLLAGGL